MEASLFVFADRSKLREKAKTVGKSGIRGELRQSSKGWFEFRTKQAAPNFIPQLAAWVKANHSSASNLSMLFGSRMTQRDDDGNVISRQKDDSVW